MFTFRIEVYCLWLGSGFRFSMFLPILLTAALSSCVAVTLQVADK